MDIKSIRSVIELLHRDILINTNVTSILNIINQSKTGQANNKPGFVKIANAQLESLKKIIDNHKYFSIEQEAVIKKAELHDFYGQDAIKLINALQAAMLADVTNSTSIWDNYFLNYSRARESAEKILWSLAKFTKIKHEINPGEGLMQISFSNGTEIKDFVKARKEFDNWYLIIEGLSQLNEIAREDFKIISFETNSPIKITVSGTVVLIAAVIGIFSDVLQIEESLMKQRKIIKDLKEYSLGDREMQITFVKHIEEKLDKELQGKIEALIVKEISKRNIPKDVESNVRTSLTKSIEIQHDFIVNGGVVNFQLGDNSENDSKLLLQQYNEVNKKFIELRDSVEQQKLLNSNKIE